MKKKIITKGFYFITDSTLSKKGNIHDVQDALKARVSAIQYRNKSDDKKFLLQEAKALRELCTAIPFIVKVQLNSSDFQFITCSGINFSKLFILDKNAKISLWDAPIVVKWLSNFIFLFLFHQNNYKNQLKNIFSAEKITPEIS